MIKSINLLIQNSRQHKKPYEIIVSALHKQFSPIQRMMLVQMSSENQNIVITIDQTKYQRYEYSTELECWGLINLNILKAENQTYHLENLWGIYKQQHWYIRNYLSGVTTLLPYNIKSVTTITQFSNVIHNKQRTSQQTIHCTIHR